MKPEFINALFTNLIKEKDYLPFRNEEGIILREDMLALQKFRLGTFYIVEIIDGDLLSDMELNQKLMKSRNFLEQSNPNQILHIIEVFVFNSTPPASKMEVISAPVETFEKKYLTCLSINLATQEVIKNNGLSSADGIEKFLGKLLKKDFSHYEMVTDINGLINEKEKQSTIRFKVKTPTVTYLLIAANIVVWAFLSLYCLLRGLSYDSIIIVCGAKENFQILAGEYWRFLTPVFLHANILHLLVNSYSLYVVGSTVERIYGRPRFLIIYFLAGIFGNIASFMFSLAPGVGASGAIFGLLGALAYYGVENPVIFKKYFGYSLVATLVINIAYGFSNVGIDNFAHLGGLTGGFLVAGVVQLEGRFELTRRRMLALFLTILLAACGLYYGFSSSRNWGYYHCNLGLIYYSKGLYQQSGDELARAREISRGDKELDAIIQRVDEMMKKGKN